MGRAISCFAMFTQSGALDKIFYISGRTL